MASLICCKRKELCRSRIVNNGAYPNRKRSDVDGIYAWIIALASFFGHVLIYGVIFSSGVFYDMFYDTFDSSSSMISLIATLSTAFTFGFGPIPGVLMNKYGQRVITIIGGLVAGTGLILSAYATNVYYLAASFGVITGIGFGTAYLAVVSIVALYFDRWRSVAFGLAVSGVGIGTFVYPPIIRSLVETFGVRGTLLVTGGVTLNLCVCGALMRPPRTGAIGSGLKESPEETACSKAEPAPNIAPNIAGKCKNCFWMLNLHMFRSVVYLVLCLNNFFLLFGLSIVYVHLAAYSTTKDIDADSSAMLISVVGIANFIGRPSFGLFAKLSCSSLLVYTISLSLCGLGVVLVPLMEGYVGLMILSAAFGFLSACIGPLIPQIITDFLSVELLPSAYGYLLVFEAAGSLLGPPVAGWLFDVLKRYPPSFYLGGGTIGLSGIIMFIPYFVRRQASALINDEIQCDGEIDIKEVFLSSKD